MPSQEINTVNEVNYCPMGVNLIAKIQWKLVVVGLFVVFLTGCKTQLDRPEKHDVVQQKKPVDQAVQQKKLADQAVQKKKLADQAVQKKKLAGVEAQQRKEADQVTEQQEQCLSSVKQLWDITARWKEAERTTASSPRIKLPTRLTNLRKIRQEVKDTSASLCSYKAKADLATSMDLTLDLFMKFMPNDGEDKSIGSTKTAEYESDQKIAKQVMDAVEAELTKIEACKGTC